MILCCLYHASLTVASAIIMHPVDLLQSVMIESKETIPPV